ncbi:MAG: hypothetical protein A2868_01955 [Candidatus Levybacteria bacterium RIFCSPHIGHO2_01_FULL_40_15b]|nr:MAG: hypothetical protein A2868_01955 [Candidatus Levybacteria bacterium RIFCSPHIGHO2_01_FULL_40_15b]
MKNKTIASILGLLSLIFFYLTYNQYVNVQSAKDVYQALDNPIPPALNISILIWLIPAFLTFFFSIKYFLKK